MLLEKKIKISKEKIEKKKNYKKKNKKFKKKKNLNVAGYNNKFRIRIFS